MSTTKTPKTTKAPTDQHAAYTLCEYLSKGSKRWGHMDHGPRVTNMGELILATITSANSALSWVAALAGESGTGKVQTKQLKALVKQVAKADPTAAPSFIEATKDSTATDGATSPRRWLGEDRAPELHAPNSSVWKARSSKPAPSSSASKPTKNS